MQVACRSRLPRAGLTFEQAAAVPIAATTALRGIRDVGEVRAGQRVLVNGAGGRVGTYAVQIAAALRAEVTGVCSTRNVELVQNRRELLAVTGLIQDGKLLPVVDRTYPLAEAVEGLRTVEQGHARGKIVVTVA